MSGAGGRRSELRVEGPDDKHALIHLLVRHGLEYEEESWPSDLPKVEEASGKDGVLGGMKEAVQLGTGLAMGFVLDANDSLKERWQSVSDRLRSVGVEEIPRTIPPDGYIGFSVRFKTRVGVWLMPDNCTQGALEQFLETLIADGDPVFAHARQATTGAKGAGARFREGDEPKAALHTWLAWQEEPGRPYGVAVRAKYFGHDSQEARAFVDWFRRLYLVGRPTSPS